MLRSSTEPFQVGEVTFEFVFFGIVAKDRLNLTIEKIGHFVIRFSFKKCSPASGKAIRLCAVNQTLYCKLMKKVPFPSSEPAGRISCQQCGNAKHFVEVAENVLVSTHYQQNNDGSFTPEENTTEIFGEVKFICAKCGEDMTRFHAHFLEMSF